MKTFTFIKPLEEFKLELYIYLSLMKDDFETLSA